MILIQFNNVKLSKNADIFIANEFKIQPVLEALIAAGNALERDDDTALRRRIEAIADDSEEDEMVRETARAVLDRM